MTTPNEQAPATRSEWLALIREAVRLEMGATERAGWNRGDFSAYRSQINALAPQPPSEG